MLEMENAIVYDYKTIKVKREMEPMVCDAYEALGWELTSTSSVEHSIFSVNLSFKRNRKINGKIELIKMQERIDNTLTNIENLQNKKKNAGTGISVGIGVVGTLTFGGGMSMAMTMSGIGFMLGGVAIGIVGAVIAGVAYPIFKKINKIKANSFNQLLENEFNKLADILEETNKITKQ